MIQEPQATNPVARPRFRERDTESPVAAEASCEHFQVKRRLARPLCPHPHPRTLCRRGVRRTGSAGKRPLETRLGFRGYTPSVGVFTERDDACDFPCFVGQVRYLRGHQRPPHKKAAWQKTQALAMTCGYYR